MPKVPTYTPQVQQSGAPNVRVSSDAPIEAFGGNNPAFGAAAGLGEQVAKIGAQEKQKADDVATTEAYTKTLEMKNRLFWNPQGGVMSRKGKDAFGVFDEFMPQFDKETDAIEQGLANGEQRQMYRSMRLKLQADFDGELQRHVSQERKVYDDQTTETGLAAERDNAIKNYLAPGAVDESLRMQKALVAAHAQRNGMDDEFSNQKFLEVASKTHAAVIDRMLTNDQGKLAEEYFGKYKDSIKGDDLARVEKAIDDQRTLTQANDAWSKVRGLRLADGNPDERRMEATVMGMDDLSLEKRAKVLQYVKARAGEELSNKQREDAAGDRTFYNTVVQARTKQMPVDEALKIADRSGRDPYDQQLKRDIVQKLYAPKTASDPMAFMDMWEGVSEGRINSQMIDQAMQKNTINASDHRTLRERLYAYEHGTAETPMEKAFGERVKSFAKEKFKGNEVQRANFEYLLHMERAGGKTYEEVFKTANDLVGKDPTSSNWSFLQEKKWKTQLKGKDEQMLATGALQEALGQNEADALKSGMTMNGGQFGSKSVDEFFKAFGGADKVKQGTPVHDAIRILMKNRKAVTVPSIQYVLKQLEKK